MQPPAHGVLTTGVLDGDLIAGRRNQGGAKMTDASFGYRPRPARLVHLPRLVAAMEARGVDGVLSYYARNVLYLAGYASGATAVYGEANGLTAVAISRREPECPVVVLPDFEMSYFLRQPTWVQDIRPYRSLLLPLDLPWSPAALERFIPKDAGTVPWVERAHTRYAEDLVQGCVQALRDLGLDRGRVACDNPAFAPLVAMHLPRVELVDGFGLLKFARMVKTDAELELLRQASRLNQTAIERLVTSWAPGMSWRELNVGYAVEVVRLGGFVLDRGSLVLANPRGSDPPAHQLATGLEDFELVAGMHVMFDCHGRYNHYNWDGGKTWVVGGEPTAFARRAARACGDAMAEILDAARPGVTLSQLQARGRLVLKRHGLPDTDAALIYFHGIGLDNVEQEWGTPADWAMVDGAVLAAHLYYHGDERHRYYIEELGVVRPHGIERFFTWDMREPLVR